MIILELTLLAAGLVGFWLATDRKNEDSAEQRPHLRVWGRFYPR